MSDGVWQLRDRMNTCTFQKNVSIMRKSFKGFLPSSHRKRNRLRQTMTIAALGRWSPIIRPIRGPPICSISPKSQASTTNNNHTNTSVLIVGWADQHPLTLGGAQHAPHHLFFNFLVLVIESYWVSPCRTSSLLSPSLNVSLNLSV